ncbi:MAG: RsmB/NOP family class I SAM-dependent RNA methyltransferase [Planctomycetota bacterium]|nr:RsmB/NOP family class I SAM-dependent RNA methyltransferase [Planctomycetota bacterium]
MLAKVLIEACGGEAEALARSFNAAAPRAFRVNALKATREEVLEELKAAGLSARATDLSPWGIAIEGRSDPFATAAFREGRMEAQDEASQLVAELVAPAPGTLVVDACAGAGGKSLALGALMRNKGVLVAVDRHGGRLAEFKRRARRAELFCHRALKADLLAEPWPKPLEALRGKAARVLVDAPCTGAGALRRNPEARLRFDAAELERLPREQERIARAALAFCKPNGRLVYATCSVLPAENERVVERLLEDSRCSLIPPAEILGAARAKALTDPSGRFLQLLPHRHGTDGFFAAVLRVRA